MCFPCAFLVLFLSGDTGGKAAILGSQADKPEIHEVFAGDPGRMDRPKVGSRGGDDDGFVWRWIFFWGGAVDFCRKSGSFMAKKDALI